MLVLKPSAKKLAIWYRCSGRIVLVCVQMHACTDVHYWLSNKTLEVSEGYV
jgi:hypothetical protein